MRVALVSLVNSARVWENSADRQRVSGAPGGALWLPTFASVSGSRLKRQLEIPATHRNPSKPESPAKVPFISSLSKGLGDSCPLTKVLQQCTQQLHFVHYFSRSDIIELRVGGPGHRNLEL